MFTTIDMMLSTIVSDELGNMMWKGMEIETYGNSLLFLTESQTTGSINNIEGFVIIFSSLFFNLKCIKIIYFYF